jgi:hypothetical protein
MKVKVFLADFAEVDAGGKVHALGLGWTLIGVPTGPMAVLAFLQFNRSETDSNQHMVTLVLEDNDGKPVYFGEDDEKTKLELTVAANITEKPGMEKFDDPLLTGVVAANLGPGIPLDPGLAYSWVAYLEGNTEPSWRAEFVTAMP